MNKERPILFNGAMVRAILDGSKTQARRVMKPQPELNPDMPGKHWWPAQAFQSMVGIEDELQYYTGMAGDCCPYGDDGDRLWVRETWRGVVEISPPGKPAVHGVARYVPDQKHCRRVEYAATQEVDADPWRPSIHMPRWASRITLEITGVRVERLQAITLGDICKEGLAKSIYDFHPATDGFRVFNELWESINGPGSWDANPWVWVLEFKRVTP